MRSSHSGPTMLFIPDAVHTCPASGHKPASLVTIGPASGHQASLLGHPAPDDTPTVPCRGSETICGATPRAAASDVLAAGGTGAASAPAVSAATAAGSRAVLRPSAATALCASLKCRSPPSSPSSPSSGTSGGGLNRVMYGSSGRRACCSVKHTQIGSGTYRNSGRPRLARLPSQ